MRTPDTPTPAQPIRGRASDVQSRHRHAAPTRPPPPHPSHPPPPTILRGVPTLQRREQVHQRCNGRGAPRRRHRDSAERGTRGGPPEWAVGARGRRDRGGGEAAAAPTRPPPAPVQRLPVTLHEARAGFLHPRVHPPPVPPHPPSLRPLVLCVLCYPFPRAAAPRRPAPRSPLCPCCLVVSSRGPERRPPPPQRALTARSNSTGSARCGPPTAPGRRRRQPWPPAGAERRVLGTRGVGRPRRRRAGHGHEPSPAPDAPLSRPRHAAPPGPSTPRAATAATRRRCKCSTPRPLPLSTTAAPTAAAAASFPQWPHPGNAKKAPPGWRMAGNGAAAWTPPREVLLPLLPGATRGHRRAHRDSPRQHVGGRARPGRGASASSGRALSYPRLWLQGPTVRLLRSRWPRAKRCGFYALCFK